jgi:hypothetical protein
MKRFLIIWTILSILITALIFIWNCDKQRIEYQTAYEQLKIVSGEQEAKRAILFECINSNDFFSEVVFPTIMFGIAFWCIPIVMASLITVALRKPSKCLLILFSIIFLSGCATAYNYKWNNPQKSPEQTQKDIEDCKYVAETPASSGSGMMLGILGSTMGRKSEEFNRCMRIKGYKSE